MGKRAFPPFHKSGRISPARQPKAILQDAVAEVMCVTVPLQRKKTHNKIQTKKHAQAPSLLSSDSATVTPGGEARQVNTRQRQPDRQEGLGTQRVAQAYTDTPWRHSGLCSESL